VFFNLGKRKFSQIYQYAISISLILVISLACFSATGIIGYKVVALLLLVAVSLLAMLFDILPVLIAALLSAFIWNFFFIPPIYTFHIADAEDALMFLMYFLIALVNIVLTSKIREAEKKARDKEEKEKTIKLYNTLLNSLSHELRTPISAIIGAVDTLKENKDKLSIGHQTELLSEIDIASMRLNRQVNNLLNMSRLESGILKLNLDWCDTNEFIYHVIQKFQQSDIKHKIVFDEDEDMPFFKLDAGILEQVLNNIIYNAIQYTPENSVIRIASYIQENNLVISITDNGKGFPEPEIKNVFDKFYRLPNSKTGGTGLGLSIAKGFTEAHHGKLELENQDTGGAKFTITIPGETTYINNLQHE
jgi:two-component system, OmpR family, sensor histidine kinase KdpD